MLMIRPSPAVSFPEGKPRNAERSGQVDRQSLSHRSGGKHLRRCEVPDHGIIETAGRQSVESTTGTGRKDSGSPGLIVPP
jgi:hypothetical protein